MTSKKSERYMDKIWESSIEENLRMLDEIENDQDLSEEEVEILAGIIEDMIEEKNVSSFSLINKFTGKTEELRQTMENDFGGTARYEGEIDLYGVRWKVYTPSQEFSSAKIRKWNYNPHISEILKNTLIRVVPGYFSEYFDYPPWILGTKYAPDTYYVSLEELINVAIARGVITGWEYLVDVGIPRLMIDDLRAKDLGSIF